VSSARAARFDTIKSAPPVSEAARTIESNFPEQFDISVPGDDEMNATTFAQNCRGKLGSQCAANPEGLGLN
jgi:hypothetical protein